MGTVYLTPEGADNPEMVARMAAYLAAIDAAADAGDREDWPAQAQALGTAVMLAAVMLDAAALGVAVPGSGALASLADIIREGEQDAGVTW